MSFPKCLLLALKKIKRKNLTEIRGKVGVQYPTPDLVPRFTAPLNLELEPENYFSTLIILGKRELINFP